MWIFSNKAWKMVSHERCLLALSVLTADDTTSSDIKRAASIILGLKVTFMVEKTKSHQVPLFLCGEGDTLLH